MKALGAGDPRTIGNYRLRAVLGSGGMGRVYLASSPSGRRVAIKMIRADLVEDPQLRQRFAREVAASRAVSGFFTAGVIDADLNADPPWLATAFVPGPSLYAAVTQFGPLPVRAVRALGAALAEALQAIHAAGLVHRDLKPANILLAADGPRVIDFGISALAGSATLTHNQVMGSPGYMSPEQIEGQPVGPPTDVFALGGVLAFAATGAGPFAGDTAASVLYHTVHSAPDLSRVPDEVRMAVTACLRKDPGQRPSLDTILAGLTGGHELGDLFAAGWLPATIIDPATYDEPTRRPTPADLPPPHDLPAPPTRLAVAVNRVAAGTANAATRLGAAASSTLSRLARATPHWPGRPAPIMPAWQALPTAPKRRGGLIAGLVVGAVALTALCCVGGIVALRSLFGGDESASPAPDVNAVPAVGVCYLDATPDFLEDDAESHRAVACTQKHDLETITAAAAPTDATYPGPDTATAHELFARCEVAADEFLGVHWSATYTQLTLSVPSEAAWNGGVRWYRCDLGAIADIWSDVIQSSGSLRGTARPITCLTWDQDSDTGDYSNVSGVDCDQAHDAELAGAFRTPDTGDLAFASKPYYDKLEAACRPVALQFLGRTTFSANRMYYAFGPRTATHLDRTEWCLVRAADGRRLIGSIEGSGSSPLPYA